MASLSFTFSPWFLVPIAIIAALLSALLYYRYKGFADRGESFKFLMGCLRWASIFFTGIAPPGTRL